MLIQGHESHNALIFNTNVYANIVASVDLIIMESCVLQNVIFNVIDYQESHRKMAEISAEDQNGDIRHSRTSSSTSSEDAGLVLSVSGLKGQRRPNSGNNNSKTQPNSLDSENAHLRAELEACRAQLKTKDEEVSKLSKIRDELENEVQGRSYNQSASRSRFFSVRARVRVHHL